MFILLVVLLVVVNGDHEIVFKLQELYMARGVFRDGTSFALNSVGSDCPTVPFVLDFRLD